MILGVTGGIGSGKSSVCRVFSVLGIPVFYSDVEAQIIMNTDVNLKNKINSIIGKDLFINGSLDRKELAGLIFSNKDFLVQVNKIVHPEVFKQFFNWVNTQNAPYVIMEAAILFESGAAKFVDKIATVIAPMEERIERVIQRNDLTRDQVSERIRNQMNDKDRIKKSDYIIDNSENEMIIPSILKIHEDILNLIQTGK